MSDKERPDGIVATVEKLTTDVYLVCKELQLFIPQDLVSSSNKCNFSL